jgi:lipoprotein NlpI
MKAPLPGFLAAAFSLGLFLGGQSIFAQLTPQGPFDSGPPSKNPDGPLDNVGPSSSATPKSAAQFEQDAQADEQSGNWDAAIADYSQAINLDPTRGSAFFHRGEIRLHQKFDTDGALIDFDGAIARNYRPAFCYDSRGYARLAKGDIDGAIADFDLAINENDTLEDAYRWRGYAKYEKTFEPEGNPNQAVEALPDLQKSVQANTRDADYPHFFIWLIQAADRDKADSATRDLKDYLDSRIDLPNDWASQIGQFLIGTSSETDLLRAAEAGNSRMIPVRQCEAYFYIGMKHEYSGDSAGALTFFQQSVATGSRHGVEEEVAQLKVNLAKGGSP